MKKYFFSLYLLCLLTVSTLFLSACNSVTSGNSSSTTNGHEVTFIGSNAQPISYTTNVQEVLIRTFYGGGLKGSLMLSPQISIYGDGTYILGQSQQGKLTTSQLEQLINELVTTYSLFHFKRLHFSDFQDQNATFLELTFNGANKQLVYGTLNRQQALSRDEDEYESLGNALRTITEALTGPTQPYTGNAVALLARRTFSPDHTRPIPSWPLKDFTLAQAVHAICGSLPPNEVSTNGESSCLKYTIPLNAVLLNPSQLQTLDSMLSEGEGTFVEQNLHYTVFLRPLLPDELPKKMLAMFGSEQQTIKNVPLLQGRLPLAPSS